MRREGCASLWDYWNRCQEGRLKSQSFSEMHWAYCSLPWHLNSSPTIKAKFFHWNSFLKELLMDCSSTPSAWLFYHGVYSVGWVGSPKLKVTPPEFEIALNLNRYLFRTLLKRRWKRTGIWTYKLLKSSWSFCGDIERKGKEENWGTYTGLCCLACYKRGSGTNTKLRLIGETYWDSVQVPLPKFPGGQSFTPLTCLFDSRLVKNIFQDEKEYSLWGCQNFSFKLNSSWNTQGERSRREHKLLRLWLLELQGTSRLQAGEKEVLGTCYSSLGSHLQTLMNGLTLRRTLWLCQVRINS